MSTAYCFVGFYNNFFLFNDIKEDLFCCTFESLKDDNKKYFKDYRVLEDTEHNVYQGNLDRYIYDLLCKNGKEVILEYEINNNKKYDNIVFLKFRSLLIDNTEIEFISDINVKINNSIFNLYDVGRDLLIKILYKLFKGKVNTVDSFLEDEVFKNICFCIPSVINCTNNSFNYVNYRSIFSHEERYKQTKDQVKSLNKIGIRPILCEGSRLSIKQLKKLSKYTDIVLFCCDDLGNNYANYHLNKSIYEVYVMNVMINHVKFDWIFKFGGRYRLMDNFCINEYLLEDNIVLKTIDGSKSFTGKEIVECIIYSIPKSLKNNVISIFEEIYNTLLNNHEEAIESLLMKFIPFSKRINKLKVIGRDAIMGLDRVV